MITGSSTAFIGPCARFRARNARIWPATFGTTRTRIGPERFSDGLDRREVIGWMLAAKTQLQTLEPALLA
jgi:hypothetical protein